MTDVGGLFFRVVPEAIRQRLPLLRVENSTYTLQKTYCESRCSLRKLTVFGGNVNLIFGSIKSSSTDRCATLIKARDGIIVNENFFATRLLLSDGPSAHRRDFDHTTNTRKNLCCANTCKKKRIRASEKTEVGGFVRLASRVLIVPIKK
jgi:hypothetical protein